MFYSFVNITYYDIISFTTSDAITSPPTLGTNDTDEKKHGILLREVYYDLTGIEIPSNNMQSDKQFNMTYIDGLKQAFSNELKAMEKYRTILKSMESRKNYDKIFEIMTDEIKHAIKYSYLLQIAK